MMKMLKSIAIALFLLSLSIPAAYADRVKIGDLYYNISAATGEAEVTYEKYQTYDNYRTLKSVHIPAMIEAGGKRYKVTSIGNYAFYRAGNIEWLSIDFGLNKIGTFAFNECNSLKSVILPDHLTTIADYAFVGCRALENIVLPYGLIKLGNRVFQGCSRLKSVEFPATIREIGSALFLNAAPTEFYLHDIGSWCKVSTGSFVFKDATKVYLNGAEIYRLIIPEGVETINGNVFAGLKCIFSISFPSTLKLISPYAFYGCTFEKLYIDNLKSWCAVNISEGNNFMCQGELYVDGDLMNYLRIPEGVNKISSNVFHGIKSIYEVYFPSRLEEIGDRAFFQCGNMKNAQISESVKKMGSKAFGGCVSLNEIFIADGTTPLSLGNEVFKGCNVENIYLGRVATENGLQDATTVKNVAIGEHVDDCRALKWDRYEVLQTITSYANQPPVSQPFTDSQYKTLKVSVPNAGREAYIRDLVWAPFWEILPNGVSLENTSLSLARGESLRINAIVTPENTTRNELTWRSSDETVAVVDSTGVVTGIGKGIARITASTVNGITAVCEISVYTRPEEIILNVSESIGLNIGEPFLLTADVLPEGCYYSEVTWTTDDETIASVDSNGRIVGVSPGKTIVTAATSDSVAARCEVIVDDELFEIRILPDSIQLYYSQQRPFDIEVKAKNVRKEDLTLSIGNTDIARLIGDSIVKACGLGETRLQVSYDGEVRSEIAVNVLPIKISISPDVVFKCMGSIYLDRDLDVSVEPALNEIDSPYEIQWSVTSSSPYGFGYDSESNSIEFMGYTTVFVRACISVGWGTFWSNKVKICSVPYTISTPDSLIIPYNEARLIVAKVGAYSSYDRPSEIKWSSSDNAVVEIVETTYDECKILAHTPGEAVVTATGSGGVYSRTLVSVVDLPYPKSITLNYSEIELNVLKAFQLNAVVTPEESAGRTIIWRSSDPDCVTVDDDGRIKTYSPGYSVITAATANGLSASCRVRVVQPATGITLDKDMVSLRKGKSVKIAAVVQPYNCTDKSVTWNSSDEGVATVTQDGEVTAVDFGDAVITATTSNGFTAECSVSISQIMVETIDLNYKSVPANVGDTIQLIPTISPYDADNKHVLWTSSDDNIAVVDNEGLVSVIKEGSCIITANATDGSNVSAECIITSKSGIDDIFTDAAERVDIFNLQGILIKSDGTRYDLKKLSPGLYIIRQGNETIKIVIR